VAVLPVVFAFNVMVGALVVSQYTAPPPLPAVLPVYASCGPGSVVEATDCADTYTAPPNVDALLLTNTDASRVMVDTDTYAAPPVDAAVLRVKAVLRNDASDCAKRATAPPEKPVFVANDVDDTATEHADKANPPPVNA
jgi:hypothetical protein